MLGAIMIFPRKKLILPCHKNGYLQSASDARKYRDRFKRNPLAKVADMFIPKPLRMSPGYPCCCGETFYEECGYCENGTVPAEWQVTLAGITNGLAGICGGLNTCESCDMANDTFVLTHDSEDACTWRYQSSADFCTEFWAPGTKLFIRLTIGLWAVNEIEVLVRPIAIGPIFNDILFVRAISVDTDCNFSNYEIYRDSTYQCPCDSTSATCHITAL